MYHNINTPLTDDAIINLKAGDTVYITGTIYTARDAAHKRIYNLILEGKALPFDLKNQTIYYVGPCPAKPGQVIGSAGPTTSGRMDAYAPKLIELGLKGMIGKGLRTPEVISAVKTYKSVYFGATGGAGALLSKSIVKEEVIAFPELGAEAIRKLDVVNFPVIVIIDCFGNNLYESGRKAFS
jgi:fumarate hydratase subunit beta